MNIYIAMCLMRAIRQDNLLLKKIYKAGRLWMGKRIMRERF